jgi:hypothetical protein
MNVIILSRTTVFSDQGNNETHRSRHCSTESVNLLSETELFYFNPSVLARFGGQKASMAGFHDVNIRKNFMLPARKKEL